MNCCESLDRNASQFPRKVAIIENEREITWQELRELVSGFAGYLADQDVNVGDRVAVLAQNSSQWLTAYYAALWLGAIAVPINTRWTPEEILFALEDSAVKHLCVDEAMFGVVGSKIRDYTESGVVTQINPYNNFCEKIRGSKAVSRHHVEESSTASIFYTGGTTGKSKGVMLSHHNHMVHSLLMVVDAAISKGVKFLHVAPMFHIADALFIHIVTLLAGVHVIVPGFDPKIASSAIRQYRIDETILVPTMIQVMMSDSNAREAFSQLKRLYYGASPISAVLLESIISRYPHLELIQLYGQTETSPVLTMLPPDYHSEEGVKNGKAKSAGRALLGTEISIFDENDKLVDQGGHGEIVARGPQVFSGYWNREEETKSALRNGWIHTGDAGYLDENGFVYVTDRIKDMIITGGENVYSVEVEQVIYQLSAVEQCCVIGMPDEKWGEIVHAVIVPKKGEVLSAKEVEEHCKEKLANFKRPRLVTLRHEPIPISGAGKFLKRKLRLEYL